MEEKTKTHWHDRTYKKLLIIPAALLLFSIIYLIIFSSTNGALFYKDISLTGGTSITVYDEDINLEQLEVSLTGQLADLEIAKIYELTTGNQKGFEVKTTDDIDKTKELLESFLEYEIEDGINSDSRTEGSSFSEGFYKQLLIAILIAFLFMAIAVFIIFKTFVPSTAVILSAFADIVMTLVLVDILGIKMSTAGIIAFLMLIGYSVDTDIMLTTRILKRKEGTINQRTFGALKTGLTMTLTSLFAMSIALIIVSSFSATLTQIFTIVVIGLGFDILNTWITNVSILKWYATKKRK